MLTLTISHCLVAKNRSIFDEKDEEFESLSDSLKRNLTLLNRRIHELKTSPSASTTNVPETTNKTILEHQKNVALILQNLMAQHFKNFENILEVRSQVKYTKIELNINILDTQKQTG